jgi:hypothetical protein
MDAIFMVGEQRSGSNLLRVMLGQAPDIAAPHPPHILQRLMPLLPLYGDLENEATFRLLVDDVCRLVEYNPVPWEQITTFNRGDVVRRCRARSLLAVFGAMMDIYAEVNGKNKWLCKSMTNIRYAQELDAYFREPKYIYLYRDGRDVVLSFTKAVIGDKHPYVIAHKWAELQRLCLHHRERAPERVFSLCYEELIADPEAVLRRLCPFLGIAYRDTMLAGHTSPEASRTARSSSLWENLTKPIMRDNSRKFLKELSVEDIKIIESVAGDCLDTLGYDRVYVQRDEEIVFDEDEIAAFHATNRALVSQCEETTDAEDHARRQRQQQVLDMIRARGEHRQHPPRLLDLIGHPDLRGSFLF